MRNRIYFFSGTGNSLHIAQTIAKTLGDCDLVAICRGTDTTVPMDLERVGFVSPVYYWGLPSLVIDFLKAIQFPGQCTPYVFGVASFGGIPGNSLSQMKHLLAQRGVPLSYGAIVLSFSNAVVYHELNPRVEAITRASNRRAQAVAVAVKAKTIRPVWDGCKQIDHKHSRDLSQIHQSALRFSVSDACISCGVCASVCPVQNIELEHGKPSFQTRCEYCLSCMQHCPTRAINEREQTKSRRRYVHPQVPAAMLASYYPFASRNSQ